MEVIYLAFAFLFPIPPIVIEPLEQECVFSDFYVTFVTNM